MVEEVLKTGQRNALSPEYLAKRLNLGTVRALQKQVEKERREGAVILSTSIPPVGYYLPENEREVRQFIRTLENRADNTLGALKSARAYLEKSKIAHCTRQQATGLYAVIVKGVLPCVKPEDDQ